MVDHEYASYCHKFDRKLHSQFLGQQHLYTFGLLCDEFATIINLIALFKM